MEIKIKYRKESKTDPEHLLTPIMKTNKKKEVLSASLLIFVVVVMSAAQSHGPSDLPVCFPYMYMMLINSEREMDGMSTRIN